MRPVFTYRVPKWQSSSTTCREVCGTRPLHDNFGFVCTHSVRQRQCYISRSQVTLCEMRSTEELYTAWARIERIGSGGIRVHHTTYPTYGMRENALEALGSDEQRQPESPELRMKQRHLENNRGNKAFQCLAALVK